MSIMVVMSWPGVSLDRYDAVRETVNWEGEQPAGGVLHVCAHDGNGLRITDIWDSAELFKAFVDGRLNPGVAQAGITTPPTVEVFPVHALFTPGFTAK